MNSRNRPKVVIIGAGFSGLWAARKLKKAPVDVLLLDRNNYHTFSPLLYQVATGGLNPEDIVYPVRTILRGQRNIRFLMNEVVEIDPLTQQVKTKDSVFLFDFLILAIGSEPRSYGIPGVNEYAFTLHNLEQAMALRNHILSCFERAVVESDAYKRHKMLTFAIAGGGPTGVEFAGALIELIRGPMTRDYQDLDLKEMRVILLEGSSHLLNSFPNQLGNYAVRRLQKMGVKVHLQAMVDQVTPDFVLLNNGTKIPVETLIWTAGVRGKPINAQLPIMGNGQIKVLPTLQVEDNLQIYVAGDLASINQQGQPLPMLAPVATQQGETAARNILRQICGLTPVSFHYRNKGNMATVGRNSAVANIRGQSFAGFFAWVLWLSIHLYNLIGFRNRLLVLIKWAWDYLFYKRTVRLFVPFPESSHINRRKG